MSKEESDKEEDKNKKRYKSKKTDITILIILVILLIIIDYPFIDKLLKNSLVDIEVGVVERVIDGDTIVVNGSNVRLLGINTPEKGERYYNEAKEFLEEELNYKTVYMQKTKEDRDLYDRKLRYVYINTTNINRELVLRGFANLYYPSGKDKLYPQMYAAWEKCISSNKKICEKSNERCAQCVEFRDIDSNKQSFTLINRCNYYCDVTGWTIKDEGRKKFTFPKYVIEKEVKITVGEGARTKEELFWKGEIYVLTEPVDTLFLRDDKGRLVNYKGY
jgi:micrococcal nuclease